MGISPQYLIDKIHYCMEFIPGVLENREIKEIKEIKEDDMVNIA